MDLAAAVLAVTVRIVDLQRPRIAESVAVTAFPRSVQTPAAVTRLGRDALEGSPAATLDDALRSVPGFSLFRRSSSRVANPTTQGVTLRGLAASGASRALVLEDMVPLNDPVGGWVYWTKVPSAAIEDVSVERGAAGDLHGADALAGAIYVTTANDRAARLLLEGGDQSTARGSGYVGTGRFFGAAEWSTTDGFVVIAPGSRGPIDVNASSRHGSGRIGAAFVSDACDINVRGSHFDERRNNGTPYQRNDTRVTQGSVDALGWQTANIGWSMRGYALTQRYEQTFSAVLAGRSAERPTSEQRVDATAGGGSADLLWSTPVARVSVGLSGRYVASELEESEFTADGTVVPRVLNPTQTTAGVTVQGSYASGLVKFGGGVRTELWQSRLSGSNRHVFVSPRVWVTRGRRLTWNAAFQSGYRGPTINELYRPFRVGSVLTDANPLLKPERAHGIEGGVMLPARVTARVVGFWSRVDDAILNVTLASSGTTIVRQRQNAARIRAAGVEIELDARLTAHLFVTGSTSFTDSVFVEGPLRDLRVPQVPRFHHAAGIRASLRDVRLSAEWRYLGRQYDDDRNGFALDDSSMLDLRAGWQIRRPLELFAAIENALDEEQDVGRTPLRTIGLPRTSRGGIRIKW
jgi:outer membrane cobalamin receptor